MRLFRDIAVALMFSGMIFPVAHAHEFWLDSTLTQNDAGPAIALDPKVGQSLDGVSLPYIPDTIAAFDWISGGEGAITGGIGDSPAAVVPFDAERGAVIFLRTEPRQLVHTDWGQFLSYLSMEGLVDIESAHHDRALPLSGFTESYTRHAKLVVPPTTGSEIADHYQGSPVEILLDELVRDAGDIRLVGRIIALGDHLPSQMTVFHETPTGPVVRKLNIADGGRFDIDVRGHGGILLNAVSMSPASPAGADWHSDWASLYIALSQP